MLEEIEDERQRLKTEKATEGPSEITGEKEEDAVLVACKDERMCLQLQEVVRHGPQKVNLTLGLLSIVAYTVFLSAKDEIVINYAFYFCCNLSAEELSIVRYNYQIVVQSNVTQLGILTVLCLSVHVVAGY